MFFLSPVEQKHQRSGGERHVDVELQVPLQRAHGVGRAAEATEDGTLHVGEGRRSTCQGGRFLVDVNLVVVVAIGSTI